MKTESLDLVIADKQEQTMQVEGLAELVDLQLAIAGGGFGEVVL
jgi:hypothetical protein